MAVAQMKNLYSIFCKVSVNSNRLFVLLEPHKFLSVPVLTIDYDNLFRNNCMLQMASSFVFGKWHRLLNSTDNLQKGTGIADCVVYFFLAFSL